MLQPAGITHRNGGWIAMAKTAVLARDDEILGSTRALSLAIVPFLVGGFALLYLWPGRTAQLWAWPIRSTMTSMMLASAYLGGTYFFLRVLRERHWHVVSTGFLAVTLFAGLLGIATLLHWDRFSHSHVAFWIWTTLYLTTPFLVFGAWLANRRYATPARPGEDELGRGTRVVVALVGLLALGQGLVMFLAPAVVLPIWPWPLTPLTCRVLGAVFCLGSAGLVTLVDPRWSSLRLMVQVEVVMLVLVLVAAVRAHDEFDAGKPLTWMLLGGFAAVLVGSVYLLVRAPRARREEARLLG